MITAHHCVPIVFPLCSNLVSLIHCGGSGIYFSPLAFIADPCLWLLLISRYRATHLQGPNFAYSLLLRKLSLRAYRHRFDLRSVRHIFNAAEPISTLTMRQFAAQLKPFGLRSEALVGGYGLAECCVYVSDGGHTILTVDRAKMEQSGEIRVLQQRDLNEENETPDTRDAPNRTKPRESADNSDPKPHESTLQNNEKPRETTDPHHPAHEIVEPTGETSPPTEKPEKPETPNKSVEPEKLEKSEKLEVRELFSCGNASKNAGIRIAIAREASICGEDRVGEIHVQSGSVARGYYPDNRASFTVELRGASGVWLSTGDLGFLHVGFDCLFVTQNGELYVCGRAKDLLIVRGRNYYPQDIEQACCLLPQVKPGAVAAIAVPRNGQESLVVVLELRDAVRTGETVETVVTQLRQVIAEENGLVPSEIVVIRPKTIPKTTSGKISRHRVLDEYRNGTLQIVYRQQFIDLPTQEEQEEEEENSSNKAENSQATAAKSIQSTLPSQLDGIDTVRFHVFSHIVGATRRTAA